MFFVFFIVITANRFLVYTAKPHVADYPWENDDRIPCPCGKNSKITRVVGGQDAGRGNYPFAVAVIDLQPWTQKGRASRPYCGGTLITDKHVLTAAHCFKIRNADEVIIDIGDYDFDSDDSSEEFRGAASVTKYPGYVMQTFKNDIAVIELNQTVDFNNADIKVAWLPAPDVDPEPGTKVTVYGWGRLEYGGSQARILQSLEMPIMSNADCQKQFKVKVTDEMLCAGGQAGHDACIGDSGSGLTMQIDNEKVLVGVVSFGKRCALPNVGGAYTRVTSFMQWIYNNTLDATCKPCIYEPDTSTK